MIILYSMSTIYKICYIKENTIEKIYVFNSTNSDKIDFIDIFNQDEIVNIERNSIPVEIVNLPIYLDDTIENIKKKIISIDKTISFEEIYLFCNVNEYLDSENIYQSLTFNGKREITKDILINFLLNIKYIDIEKIQDKDVYDYDDIL